MNSCDVEVSVDCRHEPIARIATGGQSKSCVVVWHSSSGDLGEGVVMVDLPVEGQIRVRVKTGSAPVLDSVECSLSRISETYKSQR